MEGNPENECLGQEDGKQQGQCGESTRSSGNKKERVLEIEPLGETALRIVLGTEIAPDVQREVRRVMRQLEDSPLPGMIEAVPSFAAVTVFYDPLHTAQELGVPAHIQGKSRTSKAGTKRKNWLSVFELAADWLSRLSLTDIDEEGLQIRTVDIPVRYGGEFGPDLEFVAAHSGLTTEEVVRIHAAGEYPVYMIGFAPGFPYLGGMDERIAAPRLDTPRKAVPAGAVGIAGGQTGVYPISTPGGWRIIGRTPTALFRPERMPPSLLRAGDRVRFVPVTAEEYADLALDDSLQTVPDPKSGTDRKPAYTLKAAGEKPARESREQAKTNAITVLKPGLLTTLQDLGRPGYQQYGVTAGGAMDGYALRTANLLAGNAESEAALEITLTGPGLRFERESRIALTGADLAPSIGGEPLPMWRPVVVRAGAVLEFGTAVQGCRAYLALAGGFGAPEEMGSRSTDLRAGLGGLEGRALRAGDVLQVRTSPAAARSASGGIVPLRGIGPEADFAAAAWHVAHGYIAGLADWAGFPAAAAASSIAVRFTRGTHFARFDEASRAALLDSAFGVTPQSDRMGCRLSGPALALAHPLELISEAVAPGTVQVPPDGGPIVLTADRQTTGGYPRIAQIAAVDLRIVAQLRPGQTIRFVEISLEEAERLYMERERELERLRIAIRLRSR
ncbi:5-oxoprolinase subunit PxpB [Saccharibacillus qingshengii]|uniref:5-oxoprolinase subunit PxpB n=1 Tax=Saccharibacillus qingshengii TaxID=1763540 RepID=UPI0031B64A8E